MEAFPAIPGSILAVIEGYQWARVEYGNSGAAVYRLDPLEGEGNSGRPALFLKSGIGMVAQEIAAEAERLQWLTQFLPVPEIQHFSYCAGQAWLLTKAIPGRNAYDSLVSDAAGRPAIVAIVAQFLRRFHGMPVGACPFNSAYEVKMTAARRNIESGQVNTDDFGANHEGWTAEEVWEELQTFLPISWDTVVAHGDFSLGNILIENRNVTGCIDVGRTGIADPYQDLAILWNDLAEFGPDLRDGFLKAYGIESPELARLEFHLCLDELF